MARDFREAHAWLMGYSDGLAERYSDEHAKRWGALRWAYERGYDTATQGIEWVRANRIDPELEVAA